MDLFKYLYNQGYIKSANCSTFCLEVSSCVLFPLQGGFLWHVWLWPPPTLSVNYYDNDNVLFALQLFI